jgi:hypothetical protein
MRHLFFASITTAFLAFCSNTTFGQNLLTVNPGFELGKNGWYIPPTMTEMVTDAHSGTSALKLVSEEGKGAAAFYTNPKTQSLPIKKGAKYELQFWIKPVKKLRELSLKIYGKDGYQNGSDILEFLKTKSLVLNEWQQVSILFKGADYTDAKFMITVSLGEIIVDDFSLVELK